MEAVLFSYNFELLACFFALLADSEKQIVILVINLEKRLNVVTPSSYSGNKHLPLNCFNLFCNWNILH